MFDCLIRPNHMHLHIVRQADTIKKKEQESSLPRKKKTENQSKLNHGSKTTQLDCPKNQLYTTVPPTDLPSTTRIT